MKLTDTCRCGAELTLDFGAYEKAWAASRHDAWLVQHTDCPFPPHAPEHTDLGGREIYADDTGAVCYPLGFTATPACEPDAGDGFEDA